jgi:hypothetical protein
MNKYEEIFDEWIRFYKFGMFVLIPAAAILLILLVLELFIYGLFPFILIFFFFYQRYLILKKISKKYDMETFFTNETIVLWIRKFAKEKDTYKVQYFIETIFYPWNKTITLADQNIKLGSEQSFALKKALFPASICIIILMFIQFYIFNYKFSFITITELLSGAFLFSLIIYRDILKSGKIIITENNFSTLNITKRKISGKTFNGSVLKAPSEGDLWWKIILKISNSVSAIIVEAEDILLQSKSLKRELEHFFIKLGATNIIILVEDSYDQQNVISLFPQLKNSLFIKKPKRLGFRFFASEYRDISIKIAKAIYDN